MNDGLHRPARAGSCAPVTGSSRSQSCGTGCADDAQACMQVPYQSKAWSASFREVFQSSSPITSCCKLRLAADGTSGALHWSTDSSKWSRCEAELESLTGADLESEQDHFRVVKPRLRIQHQSAVDREQSVHPDISVALAECTKSTHAAAMERHALVQACARLLQARAKLINRLQQELETGPRDVHRSSDQAGRHARHYLAACRASYSNTLVFECCSSCGHRRPLVCWVAVCHMWNLNG